MSFRIRYFSDVNSPSSPIWNAGFIKGYEVTPDGPYVDNSTISFNAALNVWTVGMGGGSGDATSLQGVAISNDAMTPTNGQFLVYNSTDTEWDVQPTVAPSNNDVLVYNSTSGEWEAQPQSGGVTYDANDNLYLTNQTVTLTGVGSNSVVIGNTAGVTSVNTETQNVIIGGEAGQQVGTTGSVAIGFKAMENSVGTSAIRIGLNAGTNGNNNGGIAIGSGAGQTNQGIKSIAIGFEAGQATQGDAIIGRCIAIGDQAGQTNQQLHSIAIGSQSGESTQQSSAIAIGIQSGQTNQQATAIAVGSQAGQSTQQNAAIAIGTSAGQTNQQVNAITIGSNAGQNTQGEDSIAIGTGAGRTNQSLEAIALGLGAGGNSQGEDAIAIGTSAGTETQGSDAIAIGEGAGQTNQGTNSIAIGQGTGFSGFGANSIAIGNLCANSTGVSGSIGLNASGSDLPLSNAGFYVNPVRDLTTSSSTTSAVHYNSTDNEVVFRDGVQEDADNVIINKTLEMSGADKILEDLGGGVVSWYQFESNANRLVDSGLNGNNLSEVGTPPVAYFSEVSGMVNVIQTNSSVHLEYTETPLGIADADFSFTCWFRNKLNDLSPTDYMLAYFDVSSTGLTSGLLIYLRNGIVVIFAEGQSGNPLLQSADIYNDNIWHHLAVVISTTVIGGDTLTVYIDGVDETSNFTLSGTPTTWRAVATVDRMTIGAYYAPVAIRPLSEHPFIANHTVSLGSLTATDVQTLYSGTCISGMITLKGPIVIETLLGSLLGTYFQSKPLIITGSVNVTISTPASNNYILDTASTISVFLPTSPSNGTELRFINNGVPVITIDAGTNTFDGTVATTQTMNQYDRLQIIYYNSNWFTF
jgi:hypothetical protein